MQNQFRKVALHLKSTLARPPIYDRAYPEKLAIASPGNPVGVTKSSVFLLFVQQDRNSSEESISFQGTYFFDNFRKKIQEKRSVAVETCIKTHYCTHCLICSQTQVICITLRYAERAKL